MIHQIVGHDIGRRQRLAGMHQQGFGTEFGIDDEHRAGCARSGHDVGAGVEVVIEAFVRGGWGGIRRIGCHFEHKLITPEWSRSFFSTKRRVAAGRRLVDRGDQHLPARRSALRTATIKFRQT
ncbi:hypothetical protein D3C85_1298830 [compost metagenome]